VKKERREYAGRRPTTSHSHRFPSPERQSCGPPGILDDTGIPHRPMWTSALVSVDFRSWTSGKIDKKRAQRGGWNAIRPSG